MNNHYDSYDNEPYLRREGILNQWSRVMLTIMGNCGKLLVVGMDWIIVLVEEQAHKLPREIFPNLRVYKNERIEHKAISDYIEDIDSRELVDINDACMDVVHEVHYLDALHGSTKRPLRPEIPKTNGHERLKNGMPIYCETP